MRKALLLLLIVIMVGSSLVACSGTETGEPTDTTEDSSTPADSDEPIVIQIGYENHPDEPIDLAVNKWAELLEEKSDGTMKLELFPSSQLGSKNDIIDQMQAGSAVITIADGAFYADRGVPDFGIVFGPYLFETWDDCWKLIESDWYKEQSAKLEEKGIKLLTSNWIYGDRHTLTKEPVRTVSDLEGMKIRVPDNTIQIKGFEVIGATPTPMALDEVYTSLQQGTIDGLENPLPVLYNGKFHEVAKYLTLDGHIKNFTTWITGTDFFNTLTAEQQQLLIDTGNEAGLYNNDLQEEATEEVLAKFEAEGVEIIEVDPAEFAKAAEEFYSLPEFTSTWSEDLYQTVKEAMK